MEIVLFIRIEIVYVFFFKQIKRFGLHWSVIFIDLFNLKMSYTGCDVSLASPTNICNDICFAVIWNSNIWTSKQSNFIGIRKSEMLLVTGISFVFIIYIILLELVVNTEFELFSFNRNISSVYDSRICTTYVSDE